MITLIVMKVITKNLIIRGRCLDVWVGKGHYEKINKG